MFFHRLGLDNLSICHRGLLCRIQSIINPFLFFFHKKCLGQWNQDDQYTHFPCQYHNTTTKNLTCTIKRQIYNKNFSIIYNFPFLCWVLRVRGYPLFILVRGGHMDPSGVNNNFWIKLTFIPQPTMIRSVFPLHVSKDEAVLWRLRVGQPPPTNA
jgi:hypothetical protein